MNKVRVSLNNSEKMIAGSNSNRFPSDGSDINVGGMKRILIYNIASNGILRLTFNNRDEKISLYGDNDAVDIPENCEGISFQLNAGTYTTARFVFELI